MLLLNPITIRSPIVAKTKYGLFLFRASSTTSQKHYRWAREHQVLTRWPSQADCNPYAILEQPRNGPYSKRRFHELVMVYHPDRWVHGTYHDIPKATRVERYRLILAANAILSDPVKRSAYDEHGVGWSLDHSHSRRNRHAQTTSRRSGSMNASWEDWETWRNEESRDRKADSHGRQHKQQAIFMCNRRFVLTVLLLATTGSCLMLAAVLSKAEIMSERDLNVHRRILEELCDVGGGTYHFGRRDRIDLFLRRRLATVS
ncbi:hypothetical protein PG993_012523 [Apiospora rasikravindrae]|uniref:J domain-containing protein n=1 Tax=Apiospora rasikravindrae TaxID=990691 RepID=A0ABR1S405_9PEZI